MKINALSNHLHTWVMGQENFVHIDIELRIKVVISMTS